MVIINPKIPKIVVNILKPSFKVFQPRDKANIATSNATAIRNSGNRITIPNPVSKPNKKLNISFTSNFYLVYF